MIDSPCREHRPPAQVPLQGDVPDVVSIGFDPRPGHLEFDGNGPDGAGVEAFSTYLDILVNGRDGRGVQLGRRAGQAGHLDLDLTTRAPGFDGNIRHRDLGGVKRNVQRPVGLRGYRLRLERRKAKAICLG